MSRLSIVRKRDGITLVELMVAVLIFTAAMLAGGRFVVGSIHELGVSETRVQAMEFAVEKMEEIRLLPVGEIAAEDAEPVPDAPDYTRSVEVRSVGGDVADIYSYRVVTVIVQPPDGFEPVRLSTGVAR